MWKQFCKRIYTSNFSRFKRMHCCNNKDLELLHAKYAELNEKILKVEATIPTFKQKVISGALWGLFVAVCCPIVVFVKN